MSLSHTQYIPTDSGVLMEVDGLRGGHHGINYQAQLVIAGCLVAINDVSLFTKKTGKLYQVSSTTGKSILCLKQKG